VVRTCRTINEQIGGKLAARDERGDIHVFWCFLPLQDLSERNVARHERDTELEALCVEN